MHHDINERVRALFRRLTIRWSRLFDHTLPLRQAQGRRGVYPERSRRARICSLAWPGGQPACPG